MNEARKTHPCGHERDQFGCVVLTAGSDEETKATPIDCPGYDIASRERDLERLVEAAVAHARYYRMDFFNDEHPPDPNEEDDQLFLAFEDSLTPFTTPIEGERDKEGSA